MVSRRDPNRALAVGFVRRGQIDDPANTRSLGPQFDSTVDVPSLQRNFEQLKAVQTVTKTGKIAFQEANDIPVPEFDVHSLPDYSGVAIIGASESGKSNWLAWALTVNNHLPWYNIFTGTASNGFWQRFFPLKSVVQGFDVNRAANILAHQANILPLEEQFEIRMGTINDDLQGTKEWILPVTKLFTRGRHFKIQTFAMVQTKNGLFKHMRLNAKLVVVFRVLSHLERVEIAKQWMGDWNLTTAVDLIAKHTSDHHGFVIDTRTSPPKLFVTKAPLMEELARKAGKRKPFDVFVPLGSKAFWASDPRGTKGGGTNFRGDITTAPGQRKGTDKADADLTPEERARKEETRDREAAAIDPPPLRKAKGARVRKGERPLFNF